MPTPIITQVVDALSNRRVMLSAFGVENLTTTPDERSRQAIKLQLRRMSEEMQHNPSLWKYLLVNLFGTSDERKILTLVKEQKREHRHEKEAQIQDDLARSAEAEEQRRQLELMKRVIDELSALLQETFDHIHQANEETRRMLAEDWDLSHLAPDAQDLLLNPAEHPVEHENQIRAMEASLQTRRFDLQQMDMILGASNGTLRNYDTLLDLPKARAKVQESYSRLTQELRNAWFNTKLIYHPSVPHKDVEAVCDRHARSFALIAALHGAHSIHAPVPHLSRSQRPLLSVFIDTIQKTRLPQLEYVQQQQQQLFNNDILRAGLNGADSEAIGRLLSAVISQESNTNRPQNRAML